MAQHYVVVLAPQQVGGWRAHFPDFPECRADGARVEATLDHATSAARDSVEQLARSGTTVTPRPYERVRVDDSWAAERGIDWSTCIISMVRIE